MQQAPLIAFGAHPDDVEFGCGAILANESRSGRPCTIAVCSRGESASNGTPAQRTIEAEAAARILGARIEFLDLAQDAHFEISLPATLKIATTLRRLKPAIVLAPTLVENQHPDHPRLACMVRDACRLARYAGLPELLPAPPHAVDALYYYAITPDAEPPGVQPLLIDVSHPDLLATWTRAMNAHASQSATRNYVDLQLTRAHLHGLRAGVTHALPLYPNDPLVLDSLAPLQKSARRF